MAFCLSEKSFNKLTDTMNSGKISSVNFGGLPLFRLPYKMLDVRIMPVANAHRKPLAERSIFAGAAHSLVVQVTARRAGRERGLPRAGGHVRGMFWGAAPTRDMETGKRAVGERGKKQAPTKAAKIRRDRRIGILMCQMQI